MRKIFKDRNKVVAFVLCLVMAIVCVTPVLFSFFTSVRSELEIMTGGFSFLPADWTFENYVELFSSEYSTSYPILRWFLNSMIVAVSQTILVVIVASASAYAYSRLEFRGKNVLFWFLMATMTFPSVINIIPMYKICQTLGIVDTLWALILPGIPGVFNIYLIRQFMLGIPKELDEAAMIDGANRFQIYYKLILPLCTPVLVVVAMFAFTGAWNDYLWPSIVMNKVDMLTITPGLQKIKDSFNTMPAHAIAGGFISVIPTFIFYLFAQKYFMKGMQMQAGVKG
ncbi:MAG: carbohydrate ABC transporter permease [Firmicutes bacterium]|nr:carbohydrate ABC transporter permease [Bacillota bacterium]